MINIGWRLPVAIVTVTVVLLTAAPVAAVETVRTDEFRWTANGEPPRGAPEIELAVCVDEAGAALADEGGWQYRYGRSKTTATARKAATFYRFDDCAVVVATAAHRVSGDWTVWQLVVWVSTDPLDRDATRRIVGRVPGEPDPVRTVAPSIITVSDCTGWNRHPLSPTDPYTGPGTVHLDKASVDANFLFNGGQPVLQTLHADAFFRYLQVGNVRYTAPLVSRYELTGRPTGTAVGDTYRFNNGNPGWTQVVFDVGTC